ncbi:DNA-binding response regulator [Aliidiomarina sedimenti]|uniref:DNA-binding response regulator n=1 Tax=Aliidiomarina sedimenti TaxID=1933879 RepID=A0ABY0C2D1_9GAMM|nr:response regulator [Aliidiomarina sedimenti]RUO31645.1 DNA-binding response regulator [Aliidiomarina sedimenti]
MQNQPANTLMRVIIVEDEAPARLKLNMQLQQLDGVSVIAECDDAVNAISEINALKPDLVFIDIELGQLSGFDVLEAISQPCHVIFTTAYSQYAVKAFEKRALDYLLKPFDLNRLREALVRVVMPYEQRSDESSDQLIAKAGDKMNVLQASDIFFVSSVQGISVAQCLERDYHLDLSLEALSNQLPSAFLRVHRNCIVNTKLISQIEKWHNGTFLLRFKDLRATVTTSRSGAVAIKKYFRL